jgi:hypothetical protein
MHMSKFNTIYNKYKITRKPTQMLVKLNELI